MPVMARQVARFQARWNAQGGSVPPIGVWQSTSAGYDNARSDAGVIRLNSRLKSDQPL
jgi:hypothetical protein